MKKDEQKSGILQIPVRLLAAAGLEGAFFGLAKRDDGERNGDTDSAY
jgi:hypothetical protein